MIIKGISIPWKGDANSEWMMGRLWPLRRLWNIFKNDFIRIAHELQEPNFFNSFHIFKNNKTVDAIKKINRSSWFNEMTIFKKVSKSPLFTVYRNDHIILLVLLILFFLQYLNLFFKYNKEKTLNFIKACNLTCETFNWNDRSEENSSFSWTFLSILYIYKKALIALFAYQFSAVKLLIFLYI